MDMNSVKSIKQQLKESTRLLTGILFKAVSSRLGKMVFDIHRENIIEKNEKEIQRIKKGDFVYKGQVEKAKEVVQTKIYIETMTICELTTICKPLKRREDGKIPNKKDQLIQKYREWSGWPAPSFDESHLMESNDDERDTSSTFSYMDDCSHNDKVANNVIAML